MGIERMTDKEPKISLARLGSLESEPYLNLHPCT